jgi:tetratricopeptide (TPR) repeat protein
VNTRFNEKWKKIVICICLAAGMLAAYEPIRHNGFVNYDDNKYITDNPEIKAGMTWESLGRAFTNPHFFMWHPLTTVSHLLDYELFGLNPLGHHLVSLMLHIVNSLFLFWILSTMTGSTWASAFVAAVFALHPLQVESVAWAAERKTVLSGFFWFLTIAVYVWYTKRPGIRRYMLLFGVYALCIMTKPIVVTLPLVLLLLDYWPLERLNLSNPPAGLKRLLIEKIPLLFMSAILCVMTFIFQQQGGTVASLSKMPFDFRLANTFISYIRYIGKMIWPSRLAVLYPFSANLQVDLVTLCVLSFILISAFAVYIGRRRRYVATGWLWYVGTLVPMVGLVQAGAQTMADRYMYVSMLGLLIIVAWLFKDIVSKRPRLRVVAALLAVVALSSAIILTRIQVRYWENEKTLFEHTLKVTKNNPIAENNYGAALFREGRDSDALPHFLNAVRLQPMYFKARHQIGLIYLKHGKLNEAIACLEELLQQNNNSAEAHYGLALAPVIQKKYDDAVNSDDKWNIYSNLGTAYLLQGKTELAIQSWKKAVKIKPDDVRNLNNLAWLLATRVNVSTEDINKAIEFAQHACELTQYKEPQFLDTLAAAYAAAGKFPDAIAAAEKAFNTARAEGKEDLARTIQNHLEFYQTSQPYREK